MIGGTSPTSGSTQPQQKSAAEGTLATATSVDGTKVKSGNAEQGKCRLTDQYLFIPVLIDCWYCEIKLF